MLPVAIIVGAFICVHYFNVLCFFFMVSDVVLSFSLYLFQVPFFLVLFSFPVLFSSFSHPTSVSFPMLKLIYVEVDVIHHDICTIRSSSD